MGLSRKPDIGQVVFYLLEGLLPEVAQLEQFFRAFADKLADGGDIAAAQAVHRAHGKIELFYRHIVFFIGDREPDSPLFVFHLGNLDVFDKRRQLLDENAGGMADGVHRLHRAIGPDIEAHSLPGSLRVPGG